MFMRTHLSRTLLILSALLLLTTTMEAKKYNEKIVWSQKPRSSNGLYTVKNFFVSNGISINANAMYYFGDVDNEGIAFNGGFNKENVSYGGSLVLGYLLPVGHHCNMRFTLMGGVLNGNNKVKFDNLNPPRDDYRKFNAFMIQPSVGVEYYPFWQAGFYLYGGISLTSSIITNYQFYYYKSSPGGKERHMIEGSTFGILPMIQLGLGYNWTINPSWSLGVEFLIQEGVTDTHYMNLDGWPMAANQNSDGVELGNPNPFSKWTDRNGKEHIHWNDGWFQLGITIAYRWRTCEQCRIIDDSHKRARNTKRKY